MKNILLILILVVGGFTFANAQTCVPDTTLADSVLVFPLPFQDTIPGTGIMDTACVNTYFETAIQFQIPGETNIGGFTIPVNRVELATEGAITGAPAGFDYVCNPPNCTFEADTTGCIVLFGTPAAGAEDVYDLKVNITIRSVIDAPLELPDGNLVTGNYFLHVQPEGSPNCATVNTNDFLEQNLTIRNVPNPFSDYTEIRVSSLISGNFSFEVYNLLGQQVEQRAVRLFEGPNFIPFDGSQLSAGMYQYILRNERGALSGKMLLSRGN